VTRFAAKIFIVSQMIGGIVWSPPSGMAVTLTRASRGISAFSNTSWEEKKWDVFNNHIHGFDFTNWFWVPVQERRSGGRLKRYEHKEMPEIQNQRNANLKRTFLELQLKDTWAQKKQIDRGCLLNRLYAMEGYSTYDWEHFWAASWAMVETPPFPFWVGNSTRKVAERERKIVKKGKKKIAKMWKKKEVRFQK
jgi:hypothetical protein